MAGRLPVTSSMLDGLLPMLRGRRLRFGVVRLWKGMAFDPASRKGDGIKLFACLFLQKKHRTFPFA
jgi:hypothetical protein